MAWIVPNEDAVTLGEIGGELYSVAPRDDTHLGDEFIRRGGTVFPLARVTCTKLRHPFGQAESLTQELDERADLHDAGVVKLAKRIARAANFFLMDDELKVIQAVVSTARSLFISAIGGEQEEDEDDFATQKYINDSPSFQAESIATINWHPTLTFLAVGQQDGVVSFYDVSTATWDARVLEHPAQVDITSVEWVRYSGGIIAVACRGGIFRWKIQPKNKKAAPVLLDILKHPTKTAFHQMSWNAEGSMMAAFAKNTSSIYVFDAIFSLKTELQCPYKISSLHWSPTGEYLFVATENGYSLMWETLTWQKEIWDIATRSCGWSNDGRCMLVAMRNKPLLYPYAFQGCPPGIDAQIASPAIKMSEKEFFSYDRSTSELVGGKIVDIAWDPTGSRVAVTYENSNGTVGELVAIFTVSWEPFLIFTRSGLLRGPPNSGVPRKLAFASSFGQGALLSLAWSSGLITFHPFYF